MILASGDDSPGRGPASRRRAPGAARGRERFTAARPPLTARRRLRSERPPSAQLPSARARCARQRSCCRRLRAGGSTSARSREYNFSSAGLAGYEGLSPCGVRVEEQAAVDAREGLARRSGVPQQRKGSQRLNTVVNAW